METGGSVAKFPLGDFLASLGKGEGGTSGPDLACPACGATLANFRETGRLGCAQCYVTFEAHLRDLLRRLHGSAVHVGERYQARPVLRPELTPEANAIRTAAGGALVALPHPSLSRVSLPLRSASLSWPSRTPPLPSLFLILYSLFLILECELSTATSATTLPSSAILKISTFPLVAPRRASGVHSAPHDTRARLR